MAFLLMCIMPILAMGGVGGKTDNRVVVGWVESKPSYVDKSVANQWNAADKAYKNIVRIYMEYKEDKWSGTGVFVSPKHVLTNTHVAKSCGKNGRRYCDITTSDGQNLQAKVVAYGGKDALDSSSSEVDWSLLEIIDKNFCGNHYFGYVSPTKSQSSLWRAGFGTLRVMTDDEIKFIKNVYTDMLIKIYDDKSNKKSEAENEEKQDSVSLAKIKARQAININEKQESGLYDDNGKQLSLKAVFTAQYQIRTDSNNSPKDLPKGLSAVPNGRSFIKDFLGDSKTLKMVKNCSVSSVSKGGWAEHNCQSWAGDSGSAIVNNNSQIVMLNSSGQRYITSEKEFINQGPVTEIIFKPDVVNLLNNAKNSCKTDLTVLQPALLVPKPAVQVPFLNSQSAKTSNSNEYSIGDECISSHLPPHASTGHYIKSGVNKYNCANGQKCSCSATACVDGYYLVVNASGNSQGWCYTRKCPSGKHLNIIDGYKTDTKCVDN